MGWWTVTGQTLFPRLWWNVQAWAGTRRSVPRVVRATPIAPPHEPHRPIPESG